MPVLRRPRRSPWCALWVVVVLLMPLVAVLSAAVGGEEQCPGNASSTPQPRWSPPAQVAHRPRIYVADNVFTPEECAELIALAEANGMEEASIMNPDFSRKPTDGKRRSLTTVLGLHGARGADGNPIVDMWRKRMSAAAMQPEANAEALAVTQYIGGEDHKYELHFDSSLVVGRIATAIVFLTDVRDGGELLFPWAKAVRGERPEGVSGRGRSIRELDGVTKEPPIAPFCSPDDERAVKIAPRAGRVVVFFTHQPDLQRESYRAMHAGCPPRTPGEDKWIAQLFIKWHDANGPNEFAQLMQSMDNPWRLDVLK